MEFLQPLALLGLGAATLPALLHLLQRRQPPTVVFPAVRYLVEAEERHSRRLRLRNLLLLILRTLLIAVIALAAARPVVPASFGTAHAPSALAVILDHSLSSGAVVGGQPRLAELRAAARAVGAAAAPGDRLWLVGADGTPRRLTPQEWRDAVEQVAPAPVRLDLGAAVRTAATVIGGQDLPGTVVVLSDLQATALSSAGDLVVPVVALEPGPAPPNRGLGAVRIEPETWSPGGVVVAEITGSDTLPVEVRVELDGRTVGRGLAGAGASVAIPVERVTPGWHRVRVTLMPDELRADDVVEVAVRGSPPAAASALGAGPFVDAALAVLTRTGRVREGRAVLLGDRPEAGCRIIFPPADPARLGAVNQALAARGVAVRYGAVETGEWMAESPVLAMGKPTVRRRVRLEGSADVLATAGGAPWIVRAGDVVVVGSRMEEAWTDLPVQPAFVPFVDALVNRAGAGEVWRVTAAPGDRVTLPGSARRLLVPAGAVAVAAGSPTNAPAEPGAYLVTGAAGDTVGVLQVQPDPRESDLEPATHAAVRSALGGARLVSSEGALVRAAFGGRRAELTTALLVTALVLAAIELAVASLGVARRKT